MAQWMIDNGSDVHQGGDGPAHARGARGDRIPMMELLVAHGADVNAEWNGDFPIIFAPCEAVDPVALNGCSSTAPIRTARSREGGSPRSTI